MVIAHMTVLYHVILSMKLKKKEVSKVQLQTAVSCYTYLSSSPNTHLPLDDPKRYGRMMVFTSR